MTDELKECREAFEKWMEKTQPFHAQGTRGMAMWEAYQDAWQLSRTKPEDLDIEAAAQAIHQCHYHPVDWGSKEWRAVYEREKPLAHAMAKVCAAAWGLRTKA